VRGVGLVGWERGGGGLYVRLKPPKELSGGRPTKKQERAHELRGRNGPCGGGSPKRKKNPKTASSSRIVKIAHGVGRR